MRRMADLLLSEKYKAFLRCTAPVEFLEGTTAAGKTTVGLFKFILRCAASPKRLHVLAGLDQGTIEKNIITKELGVLDDFGDLVEYWPGSRGEDRLPHLLLHAPGGDRKIYVMGYADKARWKKALGGQYGCLYIDEINIADIDFVREAAMRCDYLLATLNPDDPGLPVYAEFIDHARPLPRWTQDTPKEITAQLCQTAKPGWVHWFFSFEHNLGLSAEKRQQIISMVPPGTKLYKNKILGLRGRATGLIFSLEPRHLICAAELRALLTRPEHPLHWVQLSCGVDTSYSQQTADTFAFVLDGILSDRRKVTLAAQAHNNKTRAEHSLPPLAPSDIPPLLLDFLEQQRRAWGFARTVYLDSADQATITECQKYRRLHGCMYDFVPAWKRLPVLDRINLECGWLAHGDHLFVQEACAPLIEEYNVYSWDEKKPNCPEDRNDHCVNAEQYAWLPYKEQIG